MYKLIKLFLVVFLISYSVTGQKSIKGYNQSCTCIAQVDLGISKEKQYKEVASCVEAAIGINRMISKINQANREGTTRSLESLENPAEEGYLEAQLLRKCTALRTIMSTNYDVDAIPSSVKKSAVNSYTDGIEAYRSQDYNEAKKSFKKATKKVSTFTMGWDMLGLTLSYLEDYEGAALAYEKSISVDKTGGLAAVKKPQIHTLTGDNEKAIAGYKLYIKAHPEDPEGYYKIGSLYHKNKEYDKALDNTMKSFVLYKQNESPFSREALRAITLLHHDIKDNNLMHIWDTYSKKYNLTVQN